MSRVQRAARNAVILLVLGGGAAGYFFFREIQPRDAKREEALEAKRLFSCGRNDVMQAKLHSRGATIAFGRGAEGSFTLTSTLPSGKVVRWPADPDAVNALLDRMCALTVDKELTDDATDKELVDWGLSPARTQLDLELRDGAQLSLAIGHKNGLVDRYPVADGRLRRVGLSEPSFFWAFDRSLDDFRDRRLLPFRPKHITGVIAEKAGKQFRLARGEDGWSVQWLDEQRAATSARVELFLAAFTKRIRIERFLLARPESPPVASYTFRLRDEGTVRLDLRRADDTAARDTWTATRDDSESFEIDGSIQLEIERGPKHFLDHTVTRFDGESVAQVVVQLGREAPVRFLRTVVPEPGWLVDGQPDRSVKSWKLDALVQRFSYFEGSSVHARSPSPAQLEEWLLEPPSRRFRFETGGGELLAEVRIGNRFDEARLFVTSSRAPRVLLAPQAKLSVMPDRIADLFDE